MEAIVMEEIDWPSTILAISIVNYLFGWFLTGLFVSELFSENADERFRSRVVLAGSLLGLLGLFVCWIVFHARIAFPPKTKIPRAVVKKERP